MNKPRELPIIFTADSVRAILENRKSQTRRLAKFVPHEGVTLSFSGLSVGHYCTGAPELGWCLYSTGEGGMWNQRSDRLFSRFLPGDVLWVKEVWRTEELGDMDEIEEDSEMQPGTDGIRFRADDSFRVIENSQEASEAWGKAHRSGNAWRSPIYMPRWASRLTLEVTEVRAQRVQEISEEDARAEGVRPNDAAIVFGEGRIVLEMALTHRGAFACAWDRINGRRSPWSRNDLVFAYTFRRVEK